MDDSKYAAELKLHEWYAGADNTTRDDRKAAWRPSKIQTSRMIKRDLGDLDGKLGLELGCGSEGLFEFFQGEGSTLIECDLIVEALRVLRENGAENLVVGDANRLPFREEALDFIFCIGLIHHLDPVEPTLEEMVRVLKQGGSIYIFEPNRHFVPSILIDSLPSHLTLWLRQTLLPRILKRYVPVTDYERPLSARKVRDVLEGLRMKQIKQTFDRSGPPYLPKAVAVFHSRVSKALTSVFPLTSKYLSGQWAILGRK